ncbi:hypothetical protein RFF05_07265 [Bengtsoniella intestinalis]|uniref:hypothetical protein n=1 Tax=Bengtsoniella intestinalis TaxID=3073143 RepID=UPI00391F337A
MREKCFALRCLAAVFIVAFIATTILYLVDFSLVIPPLVFESLLSICPLSFWKRLLLFLQLIFGGLLTSCLLTVIIYGVEYRVKKRQAIERYVQETQVFLKLFYNLKIFDPKYGAELIIDCFHEELKNEYKRAEREEIGRLLNHTTEDTSSYREYHESFDKLNTLLHANSENSYDDLSSDEIKTIQETSTEKVICNYRKLVENLFGEYMEIHLHSVLELGNAFADISYFTGNRKVHEDAQFILNEVNRTKKCLSNLSYHLELYLSTESKNLAVVTKMLYDAQKELFQYQLPLTPNSSFVENVPNVYYNTRFISNINDALQRLLNDVYGSKHTKTNHIDSK